MKTKYFWMLLVACIVGAQSMSAQSREPSKKPHKRMSVEQMGEMQANKIAMNLGLDDKTTVRFKDVYKKYTQELNDLWKKNRPEKPKVKPGEGEPRPMPTDAEVDKMMRERFAISRKMLDIREKYYDEFRKFMTAKQVQKIFDQGMENRGKFQKEMNRRAGMKKPEGIPPGGPMAPHHPMD